MITKRRSSSNPKKYDYQFRCYYTDPISGKRKQKNSKWYSPDDGGRSACKDAEALFLANYNEIEPDRIKFNVVAQDYLNHCKEVLRLKEKTINEKKVILENIIYPQFKDIGLGKITPLMAKEWFNSDITKFRTIKRKDKTEYKKKFSTEYRNKILRTASCVFQHAIDFYGAGANPFKKISLAKKEFSEQKEMQIYGYDEFLVFYKGLSTYNYHIYQPRLNDVDIALKEQIKDILRETYKMWFWFSFHTGLRTSEQLGLRWIDINKLEDVSYIHLVQQWDERNKCYVELKTNGSKRNVTLDKNTVSKLMELKKLYKQLSGYSDKWFIFGGTKPVSKKSLENIKNKTIAVCDLKYVRLHDFRHSHASYLINNGGADCIVAVSKRLGHSSVEMTLKRYTHLLPSAEKSLLEILEK